MKKTMSAAAMLVLALAGTAQAGGQEGSLGIGTEFMINNLSGGVSANYDLGEFHVGGFLGFFDGAGDDNTDYTLGARFYYHLHSTAMSDFSIGGGLGFFSEDNADPVDRSTQLFLEPGFQIRAFVAANVALSFNGGIILGLVDADGAAITGQVTGIAGIHYYFF